MYTQTFIRSRSACVAVRVGIKKFFYELVYFNWHGMVSCSVFFAKFFFEFCLQIVDQDISSGTH